MLSTGNLLVSNAHKRSQPSCQNTGQPSASLTRYAFWVSPYPEVCSYCEKLHLNERTCGPGLNGIWTVWNHFHICVLILAPRFAEFCASNLESRGNLLQLSLDLVGNFITSLQYVATSQCFVCDFLTVPPFSFCQFSALHTSSFVLLRHARGRYVANLFPPPSQNLNWSLKCSEAVCLIRIEVAYFHYMTAKNENVGFELLMSCNAVLSV